jgi:hypothetical protein
LAPPLDGESGADVAGGGEDDASVWEFKGDAAVDGCGGGACLEQAEKRKTENNTVRKRLRE